LGYVDGSYSCDLHLASSGFRCTQSKCPGVKVSSGEVLCEWSKLHRIIFRIVQSTLNITIKSTWDWNFDSKPTILNA
jgi:hypothetical protein